MEKEGGMDLETTGSDKGKRQNSRILKANHELNLGGRSREPPCRFEQKHRKT